MDNDDIYDIKNYTEEELYEAVGFPSYYTPNNTELEAKIISMIKQNMTVRGVTGKRLSLFFQEVYKRFFDHEVEDKKLSDLPITQNTNQNATPPVQQTNVVSFTQGTLNPILKETYVRTISIDSQYRDAEYPSSTDFTMNFTETLKDVVSMKLYAVQIPQTWYTISRRYGSNYFYFKPNTDIEENAGIFTGHDYQVSIDPGNYTATTLVAAISSRISQLGSRYTDVSFGSTDLSYNTSNCKTTLTVDIQKVYNEAYYSMQVSRDLRVWLGMEETSNMYTVYSSNYTSSFSNNNSSYTIDASNNYFDIIHFNSREDETPIQTIRVILKDKTTSTYLLDGTYSANTIFDHFKFTLENNEYLLNTSTIIEISNNSTTTTTTTTNYQLSLSVQLNRFRTANIIHSKIKIRFPTDTGWASQNKQLWVSASSLFQFETDELYFSQKIIKIPVFPKTFLADQTITFLPVPNNGISDHSANQIIITISNGIYSTAELFVSAVNTKLNANEYTKGSQFISVQDAFLFKVDINKVYTTKDYKLVFFDTSSFTRCSSGSSYRTAKIDNTLGWILGFRTLVEYAFLTTNRISVDNDESEFMNPDTLLSTGSMYTFLTQLERKKDIVTLQGDTVLTIYLYNYFMIILDDYNQNHLNDGLVTIARRDSSVTLPTYANRSKYQCNPATGDLIHTATSQNALTQRQIYSVQQIINTQNTNRGNITSGPFIKDMFAILPLKNSSLPGTTYVELGGTLQVQERIYFGPVNIHRMSIKLINDKGDVVDLNGANWSIQLTCQQLYQRTPSN